MQKSICCSIVMVLSCLVVYAQNQTSVNPNQQKIKNKSKSGIGIKAGYNWSYVTANQSGVSLNSKSGYMVGAFLSPGGKRSGLGFRSEIIYSRQGYSYEDGGKNTDILNDYLYLPQLTTFTIGKVFQLQLGGQMGILLNAKKSSASKDSSMMDIMNRIDYGFAGGIELNPVAGLIIGGRYNLGLGKMYKRFQQQYSGQGAQVPYPLPFNPETTNLKNGVIQVFVGYKF
jgi:hypothetical protein